ncbi:hypermethylated in cancer 2 protein-like [Dunckerocampus dactyliophorus]|uniref:hypermethylated in cancer 2 protein-like n=1 Tax=Dunckerocampus dactyliophorus TaxID=161453 RepID=UPI0024052C25|nr:hypermethylated in cancer 2 protein-like [Dunckerocampus dactyliophorus]
MVLIQHSALFNSIHYSLSVCMKGISSHASSLLARLNHQRQQAHLCDCVLRQRQEPGQLYPAHKCVLAASSPVLDAMLSSTGSLLELQDPCLADFVLPLVLDYIYTGALPITLSWQQNDSLLAAARLLEMADLQEVLMNSPQVGMDDVTRLPEDPFVTCGSHDDDDDSVCIPRLCGIDGGPRMLYSLSSQEELVRKECMTNMDHSPPSSSTHCCESVIRHISRATTSPRRTVELPPACETAEKSYHCLSPHRDAQVPHDLGLHRVSSSHSERSSDEEEDVGSKPAKMLVQEQEHVDEEAALRHNDKCPVVNTEAHQNPSVSRDQVQASSSTFGPGGRPFQCFLCTRSFSQRGTLNRHMRSHLGVRPFRCPRCPMTFSRQYRVTEHMRVHERCSDVRDGLRNPPVSLI